jgi:hypothetical protein
MGSASLLLAALSAMAIKWPRSIAMPFAVVGIWTAVSLLVRAWKLHRKHRREAESHAKELPQPRRARERQVLTK